MLLPAGQSLVRSWNSRPAAAVGPETLLAGVQASLLADLADCQVNVWRDGRTVALSAADCLAQLLQRSGQDAELWQGLRDLSQGPVAEGLSARQLAAEAAAALAQPGKNIFQGTKQTCGAASLQYWLAREHPTEFLEVARGLASPQGQGVLPSGFPVQRVEDSVAPDGSFRNSLDRLMQAAFMGLGGMQLGQYSNQSEQFIPEQGTPAPGPQALDGLQLAILTDLVEGQDHGLVVADPLSLPQLTSTMEQGTCQGQDFPVGLNWSTGQHIVLVTGLHDGQVEFFNSQGFAPGRASGVAGHRTRDDGTQTLPLAEFQQRLAFALVPDPLLGPLLASLPSELVAPVRLNAQLRAA